MEKLIEKIEELKECLDECDIVCDLKKLNEEIYNDKELVKLLNDYNYSHDDIIKEKIISNSLFQRYKEKETDLNILILRINKELKKINSKDKCC